MINAESIAKSIKHVGHELQLLEFAWVHHSKFKSTGSSFFFLGTDVNVVADAMSHNDLAKAKSALQVPGKDLVECDQSLQVCIGEFRGYFRIICACR